jgi:hypothetical protein
MEKTRWERVFIVVLSPLPGNPFLPVQIVVVHSWGDRPPVGGQRIDWYGIFSGDNFDAAQQGEEPVRGEGGCGE